MDKVVEYIKAQLEILVTCLTKNLARLGFQWPVVIKELPKEKSASKTISAKALRDQRRGRGKKSTTKAVRVLR